MKQGWEIKKLGEVALFYSGYTPKSTELMEYGDVPYFKVSDMNHDQNTKYLKHTSLFLNNGCKTYPKNTIVFPKNGAAISTNKKRILSQDSVVDLNTGGVYANSNCLYYEYLYLHFLNTDFRLYTRRGAVPTLDIAKLKKEPISIPPLPEQERIVAELDCLSSIIEKQKEQLKELDNLAQSILYTMFGDPITNEKGWEIRKLGDICNSELGKMLDTKRAKGEYHPYLCALNVQWGAFNMDVVKEMRIEENELERYTVKNGDVLICEGGDTGRTAIWNSDNTIYYQNSLHRVRLHKDKLLSAVFLHIMHILKASGEIDKYSTGQTIKHLVKKSLLSIPLIIPALSLQQDFASKIEAIEKQKELIKQSIAESETLFNSRMDYYFN